MHTKLKVLMLLLADPSGNPRPNRALSLCKEIGYEVHVASFPIENALSVDGFYEIQKPSMRLDQKILRKLIGLCGFVFSSTKMLRCLFEMRWKLSSVKRALENKEFDLIIVEDLFLLPLAFDVKGKAKIIFDAREYYPEQLAHSWLFRLTERRTRIKVCKDYLQKCDQVITVSYGLADAYKKVFGVDCKLILSAPFKQDRDVRPTSSPIKMVHHGVANANRKLENMVDMFKYLDDRFALDFYLVGNPDYVAMLKARAAPYKNIRFLEPVKMGNIVEMLSQYDIGVGYLQDTTFNLRHCLPNKLFEFIQARLLVAIGPSPDMAKIVETYGCGTVATSFEPEDFAASLNALTIADIDRCKEASHRAAQDLCWEKEKVKYRDIIQHVIAS